MKVTPSNQTLILASERRGSGIRGGAAPTETSSTGAVLQRVTIVASQPDSTVLYLRADYATPAGSGASNGTAEPTDADFAEFSAGVARNLIGSASAGHPEIRAASTRSFLVVGAQNDHPLRDGYGNALSSRRDAAITSHLPPAEQYAQTQRLVGIASPVQRIDVHA